MISYHLKYNIYRYFFSTGIPRIPIYIITLSVSLCRSTISLFYLLFCCSIYSSVSIVILSSYHSVALPFHCFIYCSVALSTALSLLLYYLAIILSLYHFIVLSIVLLLYTAVSIVILSSYHSVALSIVCHSMYHSVSFVLSLFLYSIALFIALSLSFCRSTIPLTIIM